MKTCPVRIPARVISAMARAGCEANRLRGEDLVILRTEVGSPAWDIYQDWISSLGEVDPAVIPLWTPSPQIVGTALLPSPALVGPILTEVASIITHLAPMTMAAFAHGPPAIPGPLPAPQIPINVHHAKVAVMGIVAKIQNPQANYPTLSALGSGSYICHVHHQWTGAAVVAAVFKPHSRVDKQIVSSGREKPLAEIFGSWTCTEEL